MNRLQGSLLTRYAEHSKYKNIPESRARGSLGNVFPTYLDTHSVMGLLKKLFGGHQPSPSKAPKRPSWMRDRMEVALHGGRETLEVVGESHRQDDLWRLVGGRQPGRIREDIVAILVAESDNPHDANAISVWIKGVLVGYLSRENASRYRPGLEKLHRSEDKPIALEGVIVGEGLLGVFLNHDPSDFGLASRQPPPRGGNLRTGLSDAMATDADDDSYDLGWMDTLPDDHVKRIPKLRQLLASDPDPIDRHFIFAELETSLYRCRDAFASALDEYDTVCEQHHAEMTETIRAALLTKFAKVPRIETYKQAAIRWQKNGDYETALRWVTRGLEVYGDQAARPEAVEDLRKRKTKYGKKVGTQPTAFRENVNPPDREDGDRTRTGP